MQLLSKYNPILKILSQSFLLFIGVFILLMLFWNLLDLRTYFLYIFIVCFGILVFGIYKIRLIYLEAYCIYFNSNSLIFKNRASEKKGYNSNLIIQYTDISRINQTSTEMSVLGFRFNNYDVIFDKEGRGKETQNFYILAWNEVFHQFQVLAKEANPKLIIS